MARLAGNFTIMQLVQGDMDAPQLERVLQPVAKALELRVHVDPAVTDAHAEVEPNVRIRVHGADRAGIVADVTGALADAGLHILDLNSEVAGTPEAPVYIMVLDGYVEGGSDALASAVDRLRREGLQAGLEDTATVLG
jgi:glycine cleavage system transcriptional repressor